METENTNETSAPRGEGSDSSALVMPYLECWILVDKDGATTSQEEFGIGIINGFDFGLVCAAEKDIFESVRDYFDDSDIPENTVSALFRVTNIIHNDGQMTFPETGQWDFPPHWEMDLEFIKFESIPDDEA